MATATSSASAVSEVLSPWTSPTLLSASDETVELFDAGVGMFDARVGVNPDIEVVAVAVAGKKTTVLKCAEGLVGGDIRDCAPALDDAMINIDTAMIDRIGFPFSVRLSEPLCPK